MAIAFLLLEAIIQHGAVRAKMAAIIHSSPIGIASVDKHFRFLEVNPAYAAITGYSAPELVGRPWTQIGLLDPRHDQPGGEPVV
jgi:PAS domain S-box-containing protein